MMPTSLTYVCTLPRISEDPTEIIPAMVEVEARQRAFVSVLSFEVWQVCVPIFFYGSTLRPMFLVPEGW